MSEQNSIPMTITSEDIRNRIYTIRDVQVMLDSNLAAIYGYETKNFNRQVRNNIEKFPEDMMFRLTKEESNFILKCKKTTSSWGGSRYLPYVFTEQCIYMRSLQGKRSFADSIFCLFFNLFYTISSLRRCKNKQKYTISRLYSYGLLYSSYST